MNIVVTINLVLIVILQQNWKKRAWSLLVNDASNNYP